MDRDHHPHRDRQIELKEEYRFSVRQRVPAQRIAGAPSDVKLDNSIVNRYLSVADDEFVWVVDQDIREFIEKANQKR